MNTIETISDFNALINDLNELRDTLKENIENNAKALHYVNGVIEGVKACKEYLYEYGDF